VRTCSAIAAEAAARVEHRVAAGRVVDALPVRLQAPHDQVAERPVRFQRRLVLGPGRGPDQVAVQLPAAPAQDLVIEQRQLAAAQAPDGGEAQRLVHLPEPVARQLQQRQQALLVVAGGSA
jgi:hypothetical protein